MAIAIMRSAKENSCLLADYFRDIAKSRPLSREREVELAERIQKGDINARDELINANLRFVVDVAKKHQNRGLELLDLISAGNLGLITAAERFDGANGYKFISYAVWWIRQSILQAIANESRTVRLPINRVEMLCKISKTAHLLLRQRGEEEPTAEELAEELGLPLEEVKEILMAGKSTRSLDETFKEDEDRSLLNILADESQEPPDEAVLRLDLRESIDKVLSSLDNRDREIIVLYFGLDAEDSMTLEQIGERLGITRERVRQIKKRALKKFRHPSRSNDIGQYDSESEPVVSQDAIKDFKQKHNAHARIFNSNKANRHGFALKSGNGSANGFISDIERAKWKSTLFHFRAEELTQGIISRSSVANQSPELALGSIPFIISQKVDMAVVGRIKYLRVNGALPTADEVSEDFFGEVSVEEVERIAKKNVSQFV